MARSPHIDPTQLLSRDAFREGVLARSSGLCVRCRQPATAAHHIIERHLWSDGGYYLANGAALCDPCHLAAENTSFSVEAVREAAGIETALIPASFDPSVQIDKWGNRVLEGNMRELGPMAGHHGMLKILRPQGLVLLPANLS